MVPRPEADYAVSWIRDYDKGRVFFTILGITHSVRVSSTDKIFLRRFAVRPRRFERECSAQRPIERAEINKGGLESRYTCASPKSCWVLELDWVHLSRKHDSAKEC
jgi:hypothetical protein